MTLHGVVDEVKNIPISVISVKLYIVLRLQIVWRCDPSPIHAMMTSLVTRWKPIGFLCSCSSSNLWKLSKHVLAIPETTRQIRSAGKQPPLAIAIAKLALESLGAVLIILAPLQIRKACALMRAHITREHLLA